MADLQPNKKKKFTLTEFFIVVGIMAIMALILGPNFIRHRCYGSLTICESNLKNIGTGMEMYSTDWNGKYPQNLHYLTPNYLKTVPECPSAGRVTYRATFGANAPGNTEKFEDYYLIECTGSSHVPVSAPPDFPRYNGIEGLIDRPEREASR